MDNDADGVGDDRSQSLASLDDARSIGAWIYATPLTDLAGPLTFRRGQWYTTARVVGGCFRTPLPPGRRVLATLTLQLAPAPGTYALTLQNAFTTDPLGHPARNPAGSGAPDRNRSVSAQATGADDPARQTRRSVCLPGRGYLEHFSISCSTFLSRARFRSAKTRRPPRGTAATEKVKML